MGRPTGCCDTTHLRVEACLLKAGLLQDRPPGVRDILLKLLLVRPLRHSNRTASVHSYAAGCANCSPRHQNLRSGWLHCGTGTCSEESAHNEAGHAWRGSFSISSGYLVGDIRVGMTVRGIGHIWVDAARHHGVHGALQQGKKKHDTSNLHFWLSKL